MNIFENLNEMSIAFSKLLGIAIYNDEGLKIGKLCDFFVDYEEMYPSVIALQYQRNRQFFYVSWKDITQFNFKKITIKTGAYIGRSRTFPRVKTSIANPSSLPFQEGQNETMEYPAIGKIILDKQIVDTFGKKVVRVNDIQLIKAGQHLRVTHAAIGLRSIIRRLGYEPVVDFTLKAFRPHSTYLTKEKLINWKHVYALPGRSVDSSLRLNLSNQDLQDIHPADLADILEELDGFERDFMFHNLDPQHAADTLSEIDDELKATLIQNDSPEDLAKILENMDTDDAADILSEMSEEQQDAIITQIQDLETNEELQELLEYDEDTAGGLMTTDILEVNADMSCAEVIHRIRENRDDYEIINEVYVTNEHHHLIGVINLEELILNDPHKKIHQLMDDDDLLSVPPDMHWREVAEFMSKYDLMHVPVIDEKQELCGLVAVDDILPWLLDE